MGVHPAINLFASSLVGLATLLASQAAAVAETKCETRTQTCMDVRLGPRLCQVTTCKDELGSIVSTDVIVFKDDAPTTVRPSPKVQAPKVPVEQLNQ
jgi:hypothetical protein